MLVCNSKAVSSGGNLLFRINSVSTASYLFVRATGTGSAATSGAPAAQTEGYAQVTLANDTTNFDNEILHFMDYSATDKHKTVLGRADVASGSFPGTEMIATRFASTSAITTIQVYFGTGNIAAGSTFSLYGISA